MFVTYNIHNGWIDLKSISLALNFFTFILKKKKILREPTIRAKARAQSRATPSIHNNNLLFHTNIYKKQRNKA